VTRPRNQTGSHITMTPSNLLTKAHAAAAALLATPLAANPTPTTDELKSAFLSPTPNTPVGDAALTDTTRVPDGMDFFRVE